MTMLHLDPVSHQPVDPDNAPSSSFYNGFYYYFENDVNKRVFDESPMLWVSTPHAAQTSSNLIPGEDDLN